MITPEGAKPDDELLKRVKEILDEHGLEPETYPSALRAFLGFPPRPKRLPPEAQYVRARKTGE